MIGVGEILLLVVAFLFAGGVAPKLVRWLVLRKAGGSKQLLWELASWLRESPDRSSSGVDTPPESRAGAEDPDARRG